MNYDKWVNRNPLRRWRLENQQRMTEVAARLGVSARAVQAWERGATPKPENLAGIARLTGRSKIADEWGDWMEKRPATTAAA